MSRSDPAPPPPPLDDDTALALIAAAVEVAWPRPVVVAGDPQPPTPAWRFSGRWWGRPLPARRSRPWRM